VGDGSFRTTTRRDHRDRRTFVGGGGRGRFAKGAGVTKGGHAVDGYEEGLLVKRQLQGGCQKAFGSSYNVKKLV